jgi:hypothetical protein
MSGYIYILTDGLNTKIGVTTNLDKRISAYNTHNPNFRQYKTYDCFTIEEAKKIEAVIKLYFKEQLTGSGKEWFTVSPEKISRVVSAFWNSSNEEIITPAMHGVTLPSEFFKLKEVLSDEIIKNKGFNSEKEYEIKSQMIKLFSECLKLGIPQYKLPQEVVIKDALGLDFYHCDKESKLTKNAILDNKFQLKYDDHTYNFYHLIKLASNSYVAMCTAKISMPYLSRVEGKFPEILENARSLGLYAFQHNEWSWYYPENTGLILFMHKTSVPERVKLWETSFRKWVIERSKLLQQEKTKNSADREVLVKTIEDICYDTTFPLHVQSAEEFYKEYMEPFWGCSYNDEYKHFMQDTYDLLFNKWKNNTLND